MGKALGWLLVAILCIVFPPLLFVIVLLLAIGLIASD